MCYYYITILIFIKTETFCYSVFLSSNITSKDTFCIIFLMEYREQIKIIKIMSLFYHNHLCLYLRAYQIMNS